MAHVVVVGLLSEVGKPAAVDLDERNRELREAVEDAGEAVDEALDDASEAIDEAAESAQDAIDEARG